MPVPKDKRQDMTFHAKASKYHFEQINPDKIPADLIKDHKEIAIRMVTLLHRLEQWSEEAPDLPDVRIDLSENA